MVSKSSRSKEKTKDLKVVQVDKVCFLLGNNTICGELILFEVGSLLMM